MIGYYEPYWDQPDELEHFGVKGMKWGIRRYQNADGTLTEAGKKRNAKNFDKYNMKIAKSLAKSSKSAEEANKAARSYLNYQMALRIKNYDSKQEKKWLEGMSESMYNRTTKMLNRQDYYAIKAYEYAKKGSKKFNQLKAKYGDNAIKDLDPALVDAGEYYYKSWASKRNK